MFYPRQDQVKNEVRLQDFSQWNHTIRFFFVVDLLRSAEIHQYQSNDLTVQTRFSANAKPCSKQQSLRFDATGRNTLTW